MKQIVSLLITFLCYTSIQAKERIVELPAFDAWSSTSLEVQKIVLNDTATIVYIDAFYRPHNWIKNCNWQLFTGKRETIRNPVRSQYGT